MVIAILVAVCLIFLLVISLHGRHDDLESRLDKLAERLHTLVKEASDGDQRP